MNGDTTIYTSAIYGTLQTPSAGNIPGGGVGSINWTDSGGNIWLLGGTIGGVGDESGSNNLWEFDLSANEWAWMDGDGNDFTSLTSVYGTLGTPAAGNIPGGRYGSVSWTDKNANIWLFGGSGFVQGTWTYLNDLWDYGAPSAPSAAPSYGIIASPATVTVEHGSSGAAAASTIVGGGFDSGVAFAASGQPNGVSVTFSPTSITGAGSSQVTVSVGAGVATGDYPITLAGTSNGVTETTQITLNVTTPTPAATPTFSVAGGAYATNQSVAITDSTASSTIYYTTDGTTPTTSSTVYGGPIQVMSTETIEAIAVASGYSASAVATATYTIPQSFGMSLNPTSMTVAAGASGTSTVTVQDEGGFNGNVSFVCTGLPAGTGCSFTALTVPTPAGVSYTTLTVATSSSTAEMGRGSGTLLPGAALAVVVCCFGLKRRRRLLMMALLAVSLGGLGLLGGCGGAGSGGGSGGGGGGTQPVTSTVTVTGTSGMLSSSATFTLTVN
jgi:hypothetical protein